jgi:alpha-beta hydrolase superfamily lysophospholipase
MGCGGLVARGAQHQLGCGPAAVLMPGPIFVVQGCLSAAQGAARAPLPASSASVLSAVSPHCIGATWTAATQRRPTSHRTFVTPAYERHIVETLILKQPRGRLEDLQAIHFVCAPRATQLRSL